MATHLSLSVSQHAQLKERAKEQRTEHRTHEGVQPKKQTKVRTCSENVEIVYNNDAPNYIINKTEGQGYLYRSKTLRKERDMLTFRQKILIQKQLQAVISSIKCSMT